MKKSTIKDVANEVGVSTTTVSVVLNRKKHHISQETQEAIFKVAEKLDYRPNQLAVSMVTKKSNTLAVIVPDILNPFFAELVNSIGNEAAAQNYTTIFYCTNDQTLDVECVKSAIDRNVEVIILALAHDFLDNMEECCRLANAAQTGLVFVDRYINKSGIAKVCVDHEMGGYLATKHLLEMGHRRIACITGPMNVSVSKERLFGYIRALQEYGISFDPQLMDEGKFNVETGYKCFEDLYKKDITALFAGNDMIAYGVYKKAFEMGLFIPKDLSVVGYDNNPYDEFLPAPLTSVSQNTRSISLKVMEFVLNYSENRQTDFTRMLLKPELIIRKSVMRCKE